MRYAAALLTLALASPSPADAGCSRHRRRPAPDCQRTRPALSAPASVGAVNPPPASADPQGFVGWLNAVRARSGLGAVGHDPNLSSWANINNGQQQARGVGHHVMGPARRQNSGMGDFSTVTQMWMASPAHQAALLDPSITWVGIAGLGAYWTFSAY